MNSGMASYLELWNGMKRYPHFSFHIFNRFAVFLLHFELHYFTGVKRLNPLFNFSHNFKNEEMVLTLLGDQEIHVTNQTWCITHR